MRRPRSALAATTLVVALAATATLTGLVGTSLSASADDDEGRAKNVIYLLGDGMVRTHVTAARERFYGSDGKLSMETLAAQGYVSTYAVEKLSGQPDFRPNPVTDSASAATAGAFGVKTYNAALGVDAKGAIVPTMMELAKKAGYRTGNVSTAEITDATPAGQMSHVLARGCQGPVYSDAACQDLAVTGAALPTNDVRVTPVADQIARNGTADVILGGGLGRFDADDEAALTAQGCSVLGSIANQTTATKADLAAATGQKVFGLFNRGILTVEKSKRDNPSSVQAQEPSLPEMTSKAIELLSQTKTRGEKTEKTHKSDKGFCLQIEGALIDKRSHANDAAQTLDEIKAFDDTVAIAQEFAQRDGNTLVIVTPDHECAGFNIREKGTFTNAEAATPPANVDGGNTANNSTPTRPSNARDSARSTGIVNGTGAADAKNFGPATFRIPTDAAGVTDGSPEAGLWLSYLPGNHTGADVPIYASGPGSDQLEGTTDNIALFGIVGHAPRVIR
ncbi:alkaline phosphatase [Cryobacterium sp. TMT3-29-2]|uniref:alkaline phosphatase n=1 Tax=Cryobacterium sp. TMT3-29-2 TaxID=2555867 RepID=UPI0010735E97|nr:alkaline phosphatase [Cryobacterium sp. TMT3-29-2]TFC92219.1 alkaline phosphatase [Cryobacterium sp. TMT3-29-2]